MQRKYRKALAFALATSILSTSMIHTTITYAVECDIEDNIEEYVADESYISMDEDGNVTLIPIEEVETPDEQELAAIDNVQYEIIVDIAGEENVVNVVETEEDAVQEVETIQEIIDEHSTTEAAVEEIVTITECEETSQQMLDAIAEESIIEEDVTEEVVIEEAQVAAPIQMRSFSVMSAAPSMVSEDTAAEGSQDEGSEEVVMDPVLSEASEKTITVTAQAVTQSVDYGVVVFNYLGKTIAYTDVDGGVAGTKGGYLSSESAPDAAYLGTTAAGDIMFMQSGVVGIVDVSDYPAGTISVIDYDTYVSQGKVTSSYYTSQGKLYHAITTNTTSIVSNIVQGYQQSYMKDNTTYYSYDGHYFYTSYKSMIKDYKNNTYANAVNAKEPYYNYYQYLTHRTSTAFTTTQIDTYLKTKITSASKMWDTGKYFVEYQNTYGVNAALMMGVAINESNWGNSNIAKSKNNLFGHNATDEDAYDSANGYKVVSDSILYHARNFISYGYTDVVGDYRYYGAHVGNKQSGINVKYASDPYWGEKAAAQVWLMEMYFSDSTVDVFNETVGIVNGSAFVYESPSGKVLYNLKNKGASTSWEMPIVILEETTVNGTLWYKIQSDTPIKNDRTGVDCYKTYDFKSDYAYIKASEVNVVNGDVTESQYKLGDVNGDGKISAVDYMMIKAHIMGTTKITGTYLLAADVNKDGKISSIDYMMIKAHIMGTYTIE